MVEVVVVLPAVAAAVSVLPDGPHPSHSMSHMFFPEVGHMHDNLYLRGRQIDKMCSIGSSASSPSSACTRIPHVNAHILDKCGTMVHGPNKTCLHP